MTALGLHKHNFELKIYNTEQFKSMAQNGMLIALVILTLSVELSIGQSQKDQLTYAQNDCRQVRFLNVSFS